MALVQKPKFGVHAFYYGASDRTVWYGSREAQDRAYWKLKRQALKNADKAAEKRKARDVKHVKKVERA